MPNKPIHQVKFFLTFLLTYAYVHTVAQVSINIQNDVYNQDFNSLATSGSNNPWTNNITLGGWYATSQSDGDYATYKASDGSSGSSNIYSFGTNNDGDRSLGSINQNSSGDIAYGVLFHNNSGSTINSVTLSYVVEQWRRVETNTKGYQRTKVSYQIANAIDVSSNEILDNNNFIDIPEAYLITLDTTTLNPDESLNGNNVNNRANVWVRFPITLLDNQELFIRFYDENVSDIDMGLAVDDFQAEFSGTTAEEIAADCDYSMSTILVAGIVMDIPGQNDGIDYEEVIPSAATDFENIFSDFYQGNYSPARTLASNYGYLITTYSTGGSLFYILRKSNHSIYYWGTYVTNSLPSKSCVTIQAPHPIKDQYTGREAATVFDLLGASNFMVAGMSRCTSAVKLGCNGETSVCLVGNATEQYRISDVAHNNSSIFQIASVILSDMETNMSFVQLHGFEQGMGDPEFIFSNGSPVYPNTDNLATLQTEFQNTFPLLEVKVVHIDGASKLKAFSNVFGRYLNNYQPDICTSSIEAVVASGRFLHIEQYNDFRADVTNYDELATMLDASIDCGVILPIKLLSFSARKNVSGGVYLEWEVAWERDADYYEIQRSTDGFEFKTIAKVQALNIPENHTYDYLDNQCQLGTNYYRIKQVDLDGNYSFFPVRLIKNTAAPSLYPNPVINKLYFTGYDTGQEVRVISSDGKVAFKKIKHIGYRKGIDLSGFKRGLLILEIEDKQYKVIKHTN